MHLLYQVPGEEAQPLARFAIDRLAAGLPVEQAAWAAMDELADRVKGTGGVILVDAQGRIGMAHNTPSMSWGQGAVGGEISAGAKLLRL